MAPSHLTRRSLFRMGAGAAAGLLVPRVAVAAQSEPAVPHRSFVQSVANVSSGRMRRSVADMLMTTARECVRDASGWTVPSPIYGDMYVRDSFWVAAALERLDVSSGIVGHFGLAVRESPDGRCPTFLRHAPRPPLESVRFDESTLMFVLHSYVLARMDGRVDQGTLGITYQHIARQMYGGAFVTWGEYRTERSEEIGCYHYWIDTYRPNGRPLPSPEVMAYTQGLAAVALQCLLRMRVPGVDPPLVALAEQAYVGMRSPVDSWALPQRAGSSNLDVSALVGEALSLYWFDRSLLGRERVSATIHRFARSHHVDGAFLGFKVLTGHDGNLRPASEFIVDVSNPPGYYHNGGSWFLYDALALYAAGRHGLGGAELLLADRLASEIRYEVASHEYLSTSVDALGKGEPRRIGYGWNAFVARLFAV